MVFLYDGLYVVTKIWGKDNLLKKLLRLFGIKAYANTIKVEKYENNDHSCSSNGHISSSPTTEHM